MAPKNNLQELLDEISPRKACEKSNTDTLAFFDLHSIYSNMHQAYFTDKNITYNSNEHCIQSKKAELFDDDKIQYLIMHSSNPFEIKWLGSKVKNFERYKWESKAKEIAVNAVYCKIAQNKAFKRELLNTPKYQSTSAWKGCTYRINMEL